MKTRVKAVIRILTLVLALVATALGWETLDKIVAVVGDRPILASELELQMQLYSAQSNDRLDTPEKQNRFKEELLRQMINDRLILLKAREDTTIVIKDSDVEAALEERMEELRGRFGNSAEFEAQLAAEGYSLRDLKNKLRVDIHDQLYKDRLIGKLLSKVTVSRADVEQFYNTFRDSIPDQPATVKIAHLLLRIEGTSSADSIRALAESVRQRILDGEVFETLAQQYSEDPSGESGGDIGTFRKGDLVSDYERAALALNPGELSPVVKTQFGYHIIKLVGASGDNYHTKHILFMEKATAADSLAMEVRAKALTDSVAAGADWGLIVKNHSIDDRTRANFGELGWFAIEELPPDLQRPLSGLSVGQVSVPQWTRDGLQVFRLLDSKPERKVSLADDYDALKEYARRQKSSEVIGRVVDEMKDRVFVDVRGL